jgi:molybdate transport system substrate-binding protein
MKRRTFLLSAWLAILSLTLPLRAAEVTVFAAASLTDSLKEIAAAYEKQSGDKIIFNFAASSLLARQIEEGAPADVFFSADEAKMDSLEQKGLIVSATRKSRLSNMLVIIVAADNALKIAAPEGLATPEVKQIALADPKVVPAGIYAKEYLEKRKLWTAVESKVIPTENVRAALAAVESGNVEATIVYKTDAAISKKVKVAYEISASEGPAISYPVAVIKESKVAPAARKFVEYLNSQDTSRVFESYGFIVLK